MHKPITTSIRSTVDRSLVHCHAVRIPSLYLVYSFYILINLFIDIIHNHYQTILNIALMTEKDAYPIELMHSVASRICVFVFVNVPFEGHFV